MRLQLPTVTLCCIDCLDSKRAIRVLEHCKSMVDFGDVKLLSSIPTDYEHRVRIMPLNSLIAYSIFMLTRFFEYIETPNVLIVQRDGWILNPESFNPEWLELDYIGPIFMQMDRCGSGGFSLRSKRIMQEISKTTPAWDGTQRSAEAIQKTLSFYEDGQLSLTPFAKDFRIASLEQAAEFANGGNRNPLYFREKPFGFHRTFADIDFETGKVDCSDITRDIKPTYDPEIDAL
jgi:hypothetical protein